MYHDIWLGILLPKYKCVDVYKLNRHTMWLLPMFLSDPRSNSYPMPVLPIYTPIAFQM